MANLTTIRYRNGSSWVNLLNLIYPVGTIYMSDKETSPATLFGGTWAPITGRFPYFNAGTSTGGANSQVLNIEQLPKHVHRLCIGWGDGSNPSALSYNAGSGNRWGDVVGIDDLGAGNVSRPGVGTAVTGETKAVNNMPAYQTVYAWRRTV